MEFLNEKGVTINAVIYESFDKTNDNDKTLFNIAKKFGITYITNNELESILDKSNKIQKGIFNNVDLIISYLYPKKIGEKLMKLSKMGCINFHPAPLPEFRGVNPYSFGILEDFPYWGVTAHFIDKEFDTGDIIKVKKWMLI